MTLTFAILVSFAWMMPQHGWGNGMGWGHDGKRPAWLCVLVMGSQYGAVTSVLSGLWFWSVKDYTVLSAAVSGFLVPFGYLAAYRIMGNVHHPRPFGEPNEWGELWLGGVMLSCAPLVQYVIG